LPKNVTYSGNNLNDITENQLNNFPTVRQYNNKIVNSRYAKGDIAVTPFLNM